MDQIELFTGGHPRSNDDLMHLQGGVIDSFTALNKALTADSGGAPQNCILYGIVKSGSGPVNFTAGAAILDGEICVFDAQSFSTPPIAPNDFVLTVDESYPATNPVTYADASAHNVHKIRKARMVTKNPASLLSYELLHTGALYLKSNLAPVLDAWHTPTVNSNYPNVGAPFKYKKTIDGLLVISGSCGLDDWAISLGSIPDIRSSCPVLFNLPAGYRPTNSIIILYAHCDLSGATDATVCLKIEPSGDVSVGAPLDLIDPSLNASDFSPSEVWFNYVVPLA